MKHIKSYKIYENSDIDFISLKREMKDILLPLIDDNFKITIYDWFDGHVVRNGRRGLIRIDKKDEQKFTTFKVKDVLEFLINYLDDLNIRIIIGFSKINPRYYETFTSIKDLEKISEIFEFNYLNITLIKKN